MDKLEILTRLGELYSIQNDLQKRINKLTAKKEKLEAKERKKKNG